MTPANKLVALRGAATALLALWDGGSDDGLVNETEHEELLRLIDVHLAETGVHGQYSATDVINAMDTLSMTLSEF